MQTVESYRLPVPDSVSCGGGTCLIIEVDGIRARTDSAVVAEALQKRHPGLWKLWKPGGISEKLSVDDCAQKLTPQAKGLFAGLSGDQREQVVLGHERAALTKAVLRVVGATEEELKESAAVDAEPGPSGEVAG